MRFYDREKEQQTGSVNFSNDSLPLSTCCSPKTSAEARTENGRLAMAVMRLMTKGH